MVRCLRLAKHESSPLGTMPTLVALAHSSPTATIIIVSPTAPATTPPARRGGASTRIARCPSWATTNTSTPQTPASNRRPTSTTSLTLRRSQGVELGYYEQRHPRTLFRLSAQRLFPYHRHRPLGHDRRSCLPRQDHPLPRLRGVRIGGLVEAR